MDRFLQVLNAILFFVAHDVFQSVSVEKSHVVALDYLPRLDGLGLVMRAANLF